MIIYNQSQTLYKFFLRNDHFESAHKLLAKNLDILCHPERMRRVLIKSVKKGAKMHLLWLYGEKSLNLKNTKICFKLECSEKSLLDVSLSFDKTHALLSF